MTGMKGRSTGPAAKTQSPDPKRKPRQTGAASFDTTRLNVRIGFCGICRFPLWAEQPGGTNPTHEDGSPYCGLTKTNKGDETNGEIT